MKKVAQKQRRVCLVVLPAVPAKRCQLSDVPEKIAAQNQEFNRNEQMSRATPCYRLTHHHSQSNVARDSAAVIRGEVRMLNHLHLSDLGII